MSLEIKCFIDPFGLPEETEGLRPFWEIFEVTEITSDKFIGFFDCGSCEGKRLEAAICRNSITMIDGLKDIIVGTRFLFNLRDCTAKPAPQ